MTKSERKREIARTLLPLYQAWHSECLLDWESPQTKRAERALWAEAQRHAGVELPTTITASIGHWIARVLNVKIDTSGVHPNQQEL